MKKLLAFLYRNIIKRIFSKEEIAIYVCRTGDDLNSGFDRKKPKLTITSAVALIADCPFYTKKKRFNIVLLSDARVHQVNVTATIDKNARVKL